MERIYIKLDGNLIPVSLDVVSGSIIPSRYVQTTTADFNASGDYIGTEEYIILPADKPSGYKILNLNVKGVATNGNYLTSTENMFNENNSLYLEIDYLNTSNVINMTDMFRASKATTGYARTQTDADNFNSSSNKPATLTFVVK